MKINGMKTMNGIILKSEENKISFIFKDNEECLLTIEKLGSDKVKVLFYSNREIVKDEIMNREGLNEIGMKYIPNYLLNSYTKLIKNF